MGNNGPMNLLTWPVAAGVLTAFFATAFLVAQFAPREKPRLKSLGLFCLFYLLALGVQLGAGELAWQRSSEVASYAAAFLGWLAIIFMAATLLFKVVLPRLGFEIPSIMGDLTVGASILVLIIAGLGELGVDYTGILTTSAVVTGILALSLQPTLGNIIGGVALQLDRSIRVGDWIELADGKQGKVREIRWRHTVIETRDWDTIVVPNSTLLAANIIILGKRQDEPRQHRMWVHFNVDFRYRPTRIIRVVEQALRAEPQIPGVAQTPAPNCVCLDLAHDARESYAVYALRFWLIDLDQDDPTSSLVRQRLYAALRRADIPFAIPAAQLFIEQDDSEHREEKLKRGVQQRLQTLDMIEFVQVLLPDEMQQVAAQLHPEPFTAGETIMHQGDTADSLFILAEGEVEVWVTAGANRQRVASLEAPTFFGEMGLMTGEPRTATIIARTEVLCFNLDSESFSKILAQRPEVAEEISTILAKRQVELDLARSDLDSASASEQVEAASGQLLHRIQDFFGLK